ncbi:2Fe-2S iron-sulfur cluster-binding protein [Thiomicrorhabdus sp.]|uniref:2Fe-2S iron-sulfur cluster-binding protein n=1 Tax=Thiomicrorhabdus sp. TaxID=2039724 RepID=UPI003747C777
MGWPKSHIHYEAFAAPKPGTPFDVELKKSARTIHVRGDESMLEALEANGVEIPNMCRGGCPAANVSHRWQMATSNTVTISCRNRKKTVTAASCPAYPAQNPNGLF